jgi:hypothetical protein
MIRYRQTATGLCLTLVMTCGLIPVNALADDLSAGKAFRMPAAAFVPIGSVYSLGEVSINGRRVYGEQVIWNGELLSVGEISAHVNLDQVGSVVLLKGSSARLLTAIADNPPNRREAILTAVIDAGAVVISLQSDSVAYVEIGDSIVRSSRGSKFRVGIQEGEAVVEVERGEITSELPQPRPRYIVKPAKLNLLGKPTGPGPNTIPVSTDHFVSIPVSVEVKPQPTGGPPRQLQARALRVAYQAVAASQPAVGIDVEFCLRTDPTIGSFVSTGAKCTTERTDQYGVAKAQFHAGNKKGTSTIRATVVSSQEDYWEGTIEVYKLGFWRLRNIIILAAAVGGGTLCIVKCGQRGPLHQVPPAMIP